MRRFSALLLALAAAILPASAEWKVLSKASEAAAAGVEYRHVELQSSDGANATLDFALFSAKTATLRVIDNPAGSDRLAEAMAREKCVAGVNGGYFDTEFKPLGLRVIDGRVTSQLVRARLLTGVLCASARSVEIVRVGEFSRRRRVEEAIECGPFLIDSGKSVAHLENSRRARRTFAAAERSGRALLGICSDLTLAQMAEALRGIPDETLWRAINFDGGSSSGFWFRGPGGAVSIPEEKTVRDFVGVVTK